MQTTLFPNDDGEVTILKEDNYVPCSDLVTDIVYGDLFELGDHRLLCGDCLKMGDVDCLLDGGRVDITFTSPPYNTHSKSIHIGFYDENTIVTDKNRYYDNSKESVYLSMNDDLTHTEYGDFLCDCLGNSLKVSDDVLFNIGLLAGSKKGVCKLLYEFSDYFCDMLVWDKSHALPMGLPSQAPMVSHRAEFILCFNQTGNRKFSHSQWSKGTKDNIICTNEKCNRFSEYHNATFPLSFAVKVLKDFTKDSVLDIFGGTGTTLIASEYLNRDCYMMELNPLYCQLIINRWEYYTGEKAKKI